MKRYVLFSALLLMGCTTQPPPKTPEEATSIATFNSMVITPPVAPHATSYRDVDHDDAEFYRFANDLNWYTMYLFTYTRLFNNYAMSRGWEPPNPKEICKVINWPSLDELPEFEPSEEIEGADFEWELTNFIVTIKSMYQDQRKELAEIIQRQRELCM